MKARGPLQQSRKERLWLEGNASLRNVHDPFERPGLAQVVAPEDFQLVAVLGALEPESEQRVLGNGGAGIDHHDHLAVEFDIHLLDEMRGNLFVGVLVGAQPGFHRMRNQHLQLHHAILQAGAHLHFTFSHLIIPHECITFETQINADHLRMAITSTLGSSAVTWIWTWALFSAWAGALSLIEAEGLVADEPKSALMASSSFLAVKASLGHSAASARGGLNRPVPPAATSTAVARVFLRKVRRGGWFTRASPKLKTEKHQKSP